VSAKYINQSPVANTLLYCALYGRSSRSSRTIYLQKHCNLQRNTYS